jgi:hypothetical protein
MCAEGEGVGVELYLAMFGHGKTSIIDDGLYHQRWADAASPTACTHEDT